MKAKEGSWSRGFAHAGPWKSVIFPQRTQEPPWPSACDLVRLIGELWLGPLQPEGKALQPVTLAALLDPSKLLVGCYREGLGVVPYRTVEPCVKSCGSRSRSARNSLHAAGRTRGSRGTVGLKRFTGRDSALPETTAGGSAPCPHCHASLLALH